MTISARSLPVPARAAGAGAGTGPAANPLARRLVPDELWAAAEPLLPATRPRDQGGGRRRTDDRAVLTAVVFVLSSGGPWRSIPAVLGVAVPTAYRRFCEWTACEVWAELEEAVRRAGCREGVVAWSRVVVESARIRSDAREAST